MTLQSQTDTDLGKNLVDFLWGVHVRVAESVALPGTVVVPLTSDGFRPAAAGAIEWRRTSRPDSSGFPRARSGERRQDTVTMDDAFVSAGVLLARLRRRDSAASCSSAWRRASRVTTRR